MNSKSVLIHILKFIPDRLYLSVLFYKKMGIRMNWRNPRRFNEKLQWLKVYDRNTSHINLVDKYEVKKIIDKTIGDGHTIRTIGVWNSFEEIDFEKLPNSFVLKCTHDSGGLVICKDKSQLDILKAKAKIERCLHNNYYWYSREWPYKYVVPRIIAEEYLVDESGTELKDYKVFVFNGKPYCIQVDFNRFTEHKKNLYSCDWNLMDFSFNYPAHPEIVIPRPEKLEEMLQFASILSDNEPFVRVDFYLIKEKIYVGEITFFPASGMGRFIPDEYDFILGDCIKLPQKMKNEFKRGKNE